MGEAIQGPGPCSIYTRRISWVFEDELQEEDHLGKQPLSYFTLVARIINQEVLSWENGGLDYEFTG